MKKRLIATAAVALGLTAAIAPTVDAKGKPGDANIVESAIAANEALGVFDTHTDLRTKNGVYSLLYGFLLYRDAEFSLARRALLRAKKSSAEASTSRRRHPSACASRSRASAIV